MEGRNTSIVHCEFIIGSNASGCMVILTSIYGKESHTLTRNTTENSATLPVILNYAPSCYEDVEALDVEWNSVIGPLAVPGRLIRNFSEETPCYSQHLPGKTVVRKLKIAQDSFAP